MNGPILTRRHLLAAGLAAGAGAVLGGCGSDDDDADAGAQDGDASDADGGTLTPTPACDDGDGDATPEQTEGPFFSTGSPERASFAGDGPGTAIVLAGSVLTTSCEPVAGALLEFWHADDAGEYDNSAYLFRGHQFTDDTGGYRLDTIVPGLYPGRTRHFHVKVQAPDGPVLTTQLYFPDEDANAGDGIFDAALLVDGSSGGGDATFDFVVTPG